jgi:hypothetical protein
MAKYFIPKLMTALGLGAGAAVLSVGPADAAAQTFTQHQTVAIDGAVVTCGTTDLVASGSFEQTVHGTLDNQGIFHITGTGTPRSVTLADSAGNVYDLRGATHFGGSFIDPDGTNPIVMTATDKFEIVSPGGGEFGSVNITEHLGPNGAEHSFDFGDCTPPQ